MSDRTNTAKWVEKKKHWEIDVQRNNKRRRFYSSKKGVAGQKEANAKADNWLDSGLTKDCKFADLAEACLEDIKKKAEQPNKSSEHYKKTKSIYENYFKIPLGRKKVTSITEQDVQEIIDDASIAGVKEEPLSKKSLENIRGAFTLFMRFARKKKIINYRFNEIDIPWDAKVGERKILQPESLRILFTSNKTKYYNKIIDDWYIHTYRVMAICGLRPGENFGLHQDDVFGTTGNIKRSINRLNEITKGKNKNAGRNFAIPEIAEYEIELQIKMLKEHGIETDYIFCDPYGQQIIPHTFYAWWKRYCEFNDIDYVTPYELRHTYVSIVKGKVNTQILKGSIGHSDDMDTYGRYGHEVNGELDEFGKSVNEIYKKIISANSSDDNFDNSSAVKSAV